MTKKAIIKIKLKEEVLDPQGKAVLSVLKSSGYGNIEDVRVGKYIELSVDTKKKYKFSGAGAAESGKLEDEINEISEKILSNPLMEEFSIEIK